VRTTQISVAALVLILASYAVGIDAQQTTFKDRFCRSTPASATNTFEPDLHRVSDKGVTAPRATHQEFAQYTGDALAKRVQGCVVIEGVVEVDGRVRRYRVAQSLEESLDEASTDALKEWEFVPGQFHGTPTPVVITVEMTFSLRD